MNYLIGVDCGGTKTEAVAYDLDGKEIFRQITGFGNLIVDFEIGLANIKAALNSILLKLGSQNCQFILCGIAGIDSGGLRETLQGEFRDYQVPVAFINDGQLAHYSILKGQEGINLTAGTGSIFLARVDQNWYRAGGWGHLLGDQGSAYWISQRALKIVLAEHDRGETFSQLSREVLAYFQVEDVLSLVKEVYQQPKGKLAQLASLVSELASDEPQAKDILLAAGRELAQGVINLSQQLPLATEPLVIGLNGSVIEKNQFVRAAFFEKLQAWQQPRELIFSEKNDSCAKGVYYYYYYYYAKKDGNK